MSRGTAVASVPSAVPGPVPEEHCHKLQNLIKPCIDSFNYMLEEGLALAVQDIPAQEVPLVAEGAAGPVLLFWLEDVQIGHPRKNDDSVDPRLFPGECRERELTYAAPLMATLCRRVGDGPVERVQRKLGDIPIMVKSGRCHLAGMGPADMVRRHEDAGELGGYFICNGIERCIRMLQMPRRNHIMAIERSSFGRRGPAFSNMATSIRCVRRDQSAVTVYLHYMHDGNAMVRFAVRKQEFFVPVVLMLKALKDTTDREIYEKLVRGDTSNTFLSDRVELILQDATKQALHTRRAVLSYLGSRFRAVLDVPASLPDEAVGASLLRRFLFVHLNDDADKYELLLLMLRKLYAFVSGDAKPDNADALMNHEILLPGHMYLIFLKEKLEEALLSIRNQMTRDLRIDASRVNLQDGAYFLRCVDRAPDIGRKLYYFLATGNLLSSTGLDLMQVSGYTIVAEKLNFLRYLSHFRSVHRGQFFSEMKTTAVRKLLPENWGFLCPVHTPDGAPCGLLNHFAANCLLVTRPGDAPHLPTLLSALGMTPSHGAGATALPHNYLPVVLDGKLLGGVHPRMAQQLADELRLLKVNGERGVPAELEIAAVMPGRGGGCYPGIYLFLCSARMLRPVVHLKSGKVELIGPFEQVHPRARPRGAPACSRGRWRAQVFMEIACQEADIRADTTHREIDPTNILSVVASLTPFSDFNQSPRNMYQCQVRARARAVAVAAVAAAPHSRARDTPDGQADHGDALPQLVAPRGQQDVPHPVAAGAAGADARTAGVPHRRVPVRDQCRGGRHLVHGVRHGGRHDPEQSLLRARLWARHRVQDQGGGSGGGGRAQPRLKAALWSAGRWWRAQAGGCRQGGGRCACRHGGRGRLAHRGAAAARGRRHVLRGGRCDGAGAVREAQGVGAGGGGRGAAAGGGCEQAAAEDQHQAALQS